MVDASGQPYRSVNAIEQDADVGEQQQLDRSFKLELGSAGSLQPGLDRPTQMNGMNDIAQNLIADVVCEINWTINAKTQRPHIAVSLDNMTLRGLYNTGADI